MDKIDNIKDFIDYFKTICLSHEDIKSFDFDWNRSFNGNTEYPTIYFELPLNPSIAQGATRMRDFTIAFDVLFKPTQLDDKDLELELASKAEQIGVDIVEYLRLLPKNSGVFTGDYNSITIKEANVDNAAGARFELDISIPLKSCDNKIKIKC